MSKLTLQYQLSNGRWCDATGAQIEYFLTNCVEFDNRVSSRDEAIALLMSGAELRNDNQDWYSICRNRPVVAETHNLPEGNLLETTGHEWYDQ